MDKRQDFYIGSQLRVGRNIVLSLSNETLTSQRTVKTNDYDWLRVSNETTQDIVLPNATGLVNGWAITIDVLAASTASVNVKSYHATTPVLVKNILAGKTYRFKLMDNSTEAGVWKLEIITESEQSEAERYVATFNATTDWGSASGGYYTFGVLASEHLLGSNNQIYVEEYNGSLYYGGDVVTPIQNAAGDITIKVPEDPDLRFAGRLIIL